MKETISEINKQIFWHRVSLLWYNAKYICFWAFVIFWLHSPVLLALCLSKSIFPLLTVLCMPVFIFNGRLLNEPFFNDTNEKLALKKNEVRSVMYDKIRLKQLVKKSQSEQLDGLEYNELYYIFINIGIEEEKAEEFVNAIKSNNKL